jgi:hypothetical protein
MSYLKLTTPNNIAEEKEKFFSTKDYSPQFIYKWDQISEADLTSHPEKELLQALITQDGNVINTFAENYFGISFTRADIEFAELSLKDTPVKTFVDADLYADLATQQFKKFGIDYTVEIIDKHGFQGRPDHTHKILRLSKYLRPEFYSVDGLVKHEMVHIIRALNGKFNGIDNQEKYLGTEEGLACYVQDDLLRSNQSSIFQHSIEYMSSYIAKDHGFLDVYNFMLSKGCSPESAWLRGIRQKFGIKDTSRAGSLMKSAMQYCYEMKVKNLTRSELARLFVGKIRLDQLSKYPEYSGAIDLNKIEELIN